MSEDRKKLAARLDNIYLRLMTGQARSLGQQDVQVLLDYFGQGPDGIPYTVLKGRDATIEEWFLDHWEPK
jgi:hypothetical protein